MLGVNGRVGEAAGIRLPAFPSLPYYVLPLPGCLCWFLFSFSTKHYVHSTLCVSM